MSHTHTWQRDVRPCGSTLDTEPFSLTGGHDPQCGAPDCDNDTDEQLRIELPGDDYGTAIPFGVVSFCSVDCLRDLHSELPVGVFDDRGLAETIAYAPDLLLVHLISDGHRVQSFAGYPGDAGTLLEHVTSWARTNGFLPDADSHWDLDADGLAEVNDLSLEFESLTNSDD